MSRRLLDCVECESMTNEVCPLCDEAVCDTCYDDHIDADYAEQGEKDPFDYKVDRDEDDW